MTEIRLDTISGCRDELSRAATGIATLTPEYSQLREELALVDEQNEIAEALATVRVATDNPKMTATELKARVVKQISENPDLAPIRQRRVVLTAQLEVLDRRFRSLEKRLSSAQSALKAHETEDRAAGVVHR